MSRSTTILLVEDDAVVRQSISMLLKDAGYEVALAEDGASALATLARRSFDVLVTDFSMPGMLGDELAIRIRLRWPGQRIIMVTAFVEEYESFSAAAGHVDALLLKPFSFQELVETIERVMAGAELPFPAVRLPAYPANSLAVGDAEARSSAT